MRAVTVGRSGAEPELAQLPKPEPGEGEVVVKVEYAALNPADWQAADGPGPATAFPRVLGTDFAGRVDVVGPGDNRFRVGDAVFGLALRPDGCAGSYAEYTVVHQDGPVALVPAGLDPRTAAALPTAGTAAAQLLAVTGLRRGQSLLVVGAAGGVGSCLTQLAAARGIRVVALVRGDERRRMTLLGAAGSVDATAGDPAGAVRAACPEGVDAVADLVSGDPVGFARHAAFARAGGLAVAARPGADPAALTAPVEGVAFRLHPSVRLLEALAAAAAEGGLRTPLDAELPLEKAPGALAQNRAGGARGKTVFAV
ncbi:NADP-dependent oxidoreductase [Streptomyces sp. C10-9-1]|uniref:NADP-dependent oxidoreductase n=1 Tax=Streptomyces sp. C10-9-1 TaxID=1859285 RepID=UPI0021118918|nr:NADP-dependent oxidoreductase [Streptomyces sp. C10-9-1]MCQ6552290.1 NADP-dependent oxidoreductase [Streptomyces sp. C10-9-1]